MSKKIYQFIITFIQLILGTVALGIDAYFVMLVCYLFALLNMLEFIVDGELEYFINELEKENELYNKLTPTN